MAWTRSAQQRANIAYFLPAIDAVATLKSLTKICYEAAAPRSGYVAAAAALTFAGTALPRLDVDAVSTFLFLGGAGVAAFALRPSLTPRSSELQAHGANRRPAARFEELVARPSSSANLDREAWARLTAHMSHELRTPLNAVLGFSELMRNEVFGPMGSSFYSDYARDIHASGRMLLKSAEDALAITALLTACPNRTADARSSLSGSLREALAFHASAFNEGGHGLTTDFIADDLILADPQTVRQLMVNLIAEAFDSCPHGSTFRITTDWDGCQVRCAIAIDDPAPATAGDASFNMQLARTLSDLSGAQISERRSTSALEYAVKFSPASQRDFFAQH
jgi:signal transduction histidine kinase